MFYVALMAFEYTGNILDRQTFTFTASVGYAWVNLFLMIIALIVRVWTHSYLIRMALKMQELLRQFGHVQGYRAEIILALCYAGFVGYLIY